MDINTKQNDPPPTGLKQRYCCELTSFLPAISAVAAVSTSKVDKEGGERDGDDKAWERRAFDALLFSAWNSKNPCCLSCAITQTVMRQTDREVLVTAVTGGAFKHAAFFEVQTLLHHRKEIGALAYTSYVVLTSPPKRVSKKMYEAYEALVVYSTHMYNTSPFKNHKLFPLDTGPGIFVSQLYTRRLRQ